MSDLLYNEANLPSIVENRKTKGGFGQYLETAYFGKKADNKSQPDFPIAKLELKASPLKTLSNYEVKVKERLVLNHFTFMDLDKEIFDSSHFKFKNENLLFLPLILRNLQKKSVACVTKNTILQIKVVMQIFPEE